jgi:hypothetical protein
VKCKHKQQVHQLGYDCIVASRCMDCGHWLSLGPSNDASEAVQIEMRAAELAATSIEHDRIEMDDLTDGELSGYVWAVGLTDAQRGPTIAEPEHSAGYLARQIATHDEGGSDGA